MEQDKFAGFDILKGLTYKVVNEQPILVDVCVPKGVEGKRPLLINWHGGGLVREPAVLISVPPILTTGRR